MVDRYIGRHGSGGFRVVRTPPIPEQHLETAMRQVFSVECGYVLVLMHNRRAVQVKLLGENQLGSLDAPRPTEPPKLSKAGVFYRQPIPPAHLAYVTRELFGGDNGFFLLRMEDGRVVEIRKVPREQVAVGEDDLADNRVKEALRSLAGGEEEAPPKRGRRRVRAEEAGIGDDGDGATSSG